MRELVSVDVLQAGAVVGRPDTPIELEGFLPLAGRHPREVSRVCAAEEREHWRLELHHFLAEAAAFGEHAEMISKVLELP